MQRLGMPQDVSLYRGGSTIFSTNAWKAGVEWSVLQMVSSSPGLTQEDHHTVVLAALQRLPATWKQCPGHSWLQHLVVGHRQLCWWYVLMYIVHTFVCVCVWCVCRWFQFLVSQRTALVHAKKYWTSFTVNQLHRAVEGWYILTKFYCI